MVFALLIACPDASSYCVRISSKWQHSPIFASQNNRLSSAKRRWEIRTPARLEKIPFNLFVSIAFQIKEDNPSAQSRKRYGDKWSPCLMSRVGVMKPFGSPLMSIEYVAVFIISMAKVTHCSGSPIFKIIHRRNSHSTLS